MKNLILLLLLFVCIGCRSQEANERQEIAESYISFCKTMNAQLPARVDELTVLESMTFYDWTLTAKYRLDLYKSDFTESEWKQNLEGIKAIMLSNVAPLVYQAGGGNVSVNELSKFYQDLGFRFKALYTDINGEVVGAIIIKPEEFVTE